MGFFKAILSPVGFDLVGEHLDESLYRWIGLLGVVVQTVMFVTYAADLVALSQPYLVMLALTGFAIVYMLGRADGFTDGIQEASQAHLDAVKSSATAVTLIQTIEEELDDETLAQVKAAFETNMGDTIDDINDQVDHLDAVRGPKFDDHDQDTPSEEE